MKDSQKKTQKIENEKKKERKTKKQKTKRRSTEKTFKKQILTNAEGYFFFQKKGETRIKDKRDVKHKKKSKTCSKIQSFLGNRRK